MLLFSSQASSTWMFPPLSSKQLTRPVPDPGPQQGQNYSPPSIGLLVPPRTALVIDVLPPMLSTLCKSMFYSQDTFYTHASRTIKAGAEPKHTRVSKGRLCFLFDGFWFSSNGSAKPKQSHTCGLWALETFDCKMTWYNDLLDLSLSPACCILLEVHVVLISKR